MLTEEERWETIPAGLQEIFQSISESDRSANLEYLLQLAPDKQLLKYIMEDMSNVNANAPVLSTQASAVEDSQSEMLLSTAITKQYLSKSLEFTEQLQKPSFLVPQFFSGETQINLLPKGFSFLTKWDACLIVLSIFLKVIVYYFMQLILPLILQCFSVLEQELNFHLITSILSLYSFKKTQL